MNYSNLQVMKSNTFYESSDHKSVDEMSLLLCMFGYFKFEFENIGFPIKLEFNSEIS